MKKTLALILAALMLMPMAACSGEEAAENDIQPSSGETEPAETEPEILTDEYGRELVESAIPDELDFGGSTVTIVSRPATSIFNCEYEFFVEEDSAEVVQSAVFNRNLETENELGIDLNVELIDHNAMMTNVRNSHAANDGAYDIISSYAYYGVQLAAEGIYYNLHKLPHIALDKPWWSQNFVDEMTIYDQLFFVSGDLSLTSVQCTHAIFFNKELLNTYYGDENLYEKVQNGTWTVDYFQNLVAGCYQDANGNGRDEGDIYGVGVSGVSIPVDAYLDAFDLAVTTKNADGLPELTYNNEKTVNAFDKLYSLTFENEGSLLGPTTLDTYFMFQKKFLQSEMLFLIDLFQATESLRDMESDYGVLPMFKYEEAQKGYYTNAADIYSVLSVASASMNLEATGAVFELMAQKSYEKVIPAYFEVSLKQKYSRGNLDADMYDIVLDGIRYNFGFVHSADIGNPIWIWRNLLTNQSKDFVSSYKAQEKPAKKMLEKLLEKYQETAELQSGTEE